MPTTLKAETLRALAEGPQLQRIIFTCEGCKHLTTEDWVEYPDGERDSGTSAWCNVGEKRNLSAYWSPGNQPPSWCPFPTALLEADKDEVEQMLRILAVFERHYNANNCDGRDGNVSIPVSALRAAASFLSARRALGKDQAS